VIVIIKFVSKRFDNSSSVSLVLQDLTVYDDSIYARWRLSVKCGIAACGMRKVICGTECVESWCGTLGNMRNAENCRVSCQTSDYLLSATPHINPFALQCIRPIGKPKVLFNENLTRQTALYGTVPYVDRFPCESDDQLKINMTS